MRLLRFLLGAVSRSVSFTAMVSGTSKISKLAKVNRFVKIVSSVVGDYSYVGPRTRLDNVIVGKFCSISWDCDIGLNSHAIDCISTSPIFFFKKNGVGIKWVESDFKDAHPITSIGNDVWIGAGAKIMAGITVNHGAVIGAGSVVTKDIPAYAIVVGAPARVVGFRFEREVLELILASNWWDMPEFAIKRNIDFMKIKNPGIDDVKKFLDNLRS